MSETTANYLCIGCPLGCRLEVAVDAENQPVEVRGFSCKRGKDYALQEHTGAQRIVTTTVALAGGSWPRLPVKTDRPVPKNMVVEISRALRRVRVRAPVSMGQVIVLDVLGAGADVVATRAMPAAEAAGDC
jgi:CxxC motif-containing protein